MVSVPLASAIGATVEHDGCDHGATVHEWHANDDCGNHTQSSDKAGSNQRTARSSGRCHCVHFGVLQSASNLMAIVAPPAQAEGFPREPRGPAYSAPDFEFLRPPN
jgi:hypothetical protein